MWGVVVSLVATKGKTIASLTTTANGRSPLGVRTVRALL